MLQEKFTNMLMIFQRKQKKNVSCLAHKIFGFNFYFVAKAIRLPVWKTKDLNIGGNNLSNINFAN